MKKLNREQKIQDAITRMEAIREKLQFAFDRAEKLKGEGKVAA